MANQEHLEILKQGVKAWNQWRKEHPEIQPDLRDADLRNVNLHGANLENADLRETNLSGANLSEAKLFRGDLSMANFVGADLSNAFLWEVEFSTADLSGSNFSGASFLNAEFSNVNLEGADLTGAYLYYTIFIGVDLRTVKGLDTVIHDGPSQIDISTIYHSHGNIPESFLRGAGIDDTFITYIRSLVGKPIDYYSCFISYSSKDEAFAKRLYADLQSNNVRCWFAPEDMKTGDIIRSRIDEAIRVYDKLLLVLSRHSVESSWVEKEVETAFEKERQQKRHVLFPVRLDDGVMQSRTGWAADIRRMRHITDFTDWKSHDAYQKAFARLLRDLKAEI